MVTEQGSLDEMSGRIEKYKNIRDRVYMYKYNGDGKNKQLQIGVLVIDHDGESPHLRKIPKLFN